MNKLIAKWQEKSFLQKFFVLFIIFSALLWTLVPATYHSSLHFDPAETLMWGSTFNLGSAKHPPMSGYMLYHFCELFGFQNFSIFLLSQLCVTIGFIYLYKSSRCFFDRDTSVMAVLLITFYFFYNFETPKFNANIPHLLFIPMMCYYFYRGTTANKWHHWLLLAVSAAGACLSKYSGAVVFVSFLLYLLSEKSARKCLFSVKPYAAALLFILLMTPHIIHLVKSDFLVFGYVAHGKAMEYSYAVQLLVLICALLLPLLCMAAAGALSCFVGEKRLPNKNSFKLQITNPAAAKYAWCLLGGQAGFLLLMGLCGHRLLTIWTFPLFLSAGILLMSYYPVPVTERSKRVFALLAVLFGAVMLLIPLINYNRSSKFRYHLDKETFRQRAENFYRQQTGKEIPLIIGDIYNASMLQNCCKYTVKAAPAADPLLLSLHRQQLIDKGALIITKDISGTETAIKSWANIEKLDWYEYSISYRARFGKEKKYTFYMAVLPPDSIKRGE